MFNPENVIYKKTILPVKWSPDMECPVILYVTKEINFYSMHIASFWGIRHLRVETHRETAIERGVDVARAWAAKSPVEIAMDLDAPPDDIKDIQKDWDQHQNG